MKHLKYALVPLLIILFVSCKKEPYLVYSSGDRLQFGPDTTRIYQTSYNLADTTKDATFVYDPANVTQDTAWFDIYTAGDVSSKDRAFTLQQIPDSTGAINAMPGVDYKAFTDPSVLPAYTIKAGTVHQHVPIVMLRSANLKTTTVTLIFKIVANENFVPGSNTNIWRKLTFTDRLTKPAAWTTSFDKYYFGIYSRVKHQFMIDATGYKWDQAFCLTVTSDYGFLINETLTLKTALINYNNAHPGNPLTDENGDLVVFP